MSSACCLHVLHDYLYEYCYGCFLFPLMKPLIIEMNYCRLLKLSKLHCRHIRVWNYLLVSLWTLSMFVGVVTLRYQHYTILCGVDDGVRCLWELWHSINVNDNRVTQLPKT